MADITKCSGNYCELRESCYRFKAKDDEFRQSYFLNAPNSTSYKCDMYWEYCDKCHQYNGLHKVSCQTKKAIIIV